MLNNPLSYTGQLSLAEQVRGKIVIIFFHRACPNFLGMATAGRYIF